MDKARTSVYGTSEWAPETLSTQQGVYNEQRVPARRWGSSRPLTNENAGFSFSKLESLPIKTVLCGFFLGAKQF